MNSEQPLSVVFAGFRETGKTTFLVALWHTVLKNEVPGALTLETFYEGDREYITSRHAEWLAYEPVKRTLVDHSIPIRMSLRETQQGRLLQLGIPDLSGETFKVQFEERHASQALVTAIREAHGVAIFINPERVADPTRIREAWDAIEDEGGDGHPAAAPDETPRDASSPLGQIGPPSVELSPPEHDPVAVPDGDKTTVVPSDEAATKKPDEFTVDKCCTQVKYVDLLQQLVEHGPSTPLRCAVIVSAMDTLDGTQFEDRPEEFIRVRMSMLDQLLKTRSDLFKSRIYGVSAQGGKYDDATIDSLAKKGAHRIRVCTAGQRDNDISRPLRWLAFGEE